MAVSLSSLVPKVALGRFRFYITAPDGKRKLKIQTLDSLKYPTELEMSGHRGGYEEGSARDGGAAFDCSGGGLGACVCVTPCGVVEAICSKAFDGHDSLACRGRERNLA